jgi:hypothetical protein
MILIISISMFFLSLFTFITVNQHTNRDTHRDTERERPYFCPFLQLALHKLLGVSESVCAWDGQQHKLPPKNNKTHNFFVVVVKLFFSLTEEEEEEDRKNKQTLLSEIMNPANGFFWNCNNKQTDRQTDT